MNFKYALGLVGVLLLAGSSLLGQSMDLSGHWKGTITQNPGGFKTIYDFEVVLKQEGEKITGVSYVLVDTIFAKMSLSGALDSEEYFNFEELEIIDFSAF
ncbi:MAG: hypothetical protein KDC44_19490, partial [Phaeodactylibacter sp.]|nr:hypothetical protein [Phaeodactylibacter sp.]